MIVIMVIESSPDVPAVVILKFSRWGKLLLPPELKILKTLGIFCENIKPAIKS